MTDAVLTAAPAATPPSNDAASAAPPPGGQSPMPHAVPAPSAATVAEAGRALAADSALLAHALGQLAGAAEAKAKQEIHQHLDALEGSVASLADELKAHVTAVTASLSLTLAGRASHLATAAAFFLIGAGAAACAAAVLVGLKTILG